MTLQDANSTVSGRRLARSAGALLAGFASIFILSLGTDQLMHSLAVFPPWGEPMRDASLNLLALGYRSVYGVIGGYLTARLAPYAPTAHALVLGAVGLALSTLGAIAMWDFGPNWFPVALALSAIPCAWVGAVLFARNG